MTYIPNKQMPIPSIGTSARVGPALGRIWHDLGGVRLAEPRNVIVTSHVYRAIDRGDIIWLDAPTQPEPKDDVPTPDMVKPACVSEIEMEKPVKKPRRKNTKSATKPTS